MLLTGMFAILAQAVAGSGGETFDAVALDSGGEVVIRRGDRPGYRVTEEDAGRSEVTVADGRLTIRRCVRRCPHRYRFRVEVTVPALSALSVSNGGSIAVQDDVPVRGSLVARVEQGGGIDLRALCAGTLTASVFSGGRIFARVEDRLDASVEEGGQILYWGRPRLRHSIRKGGVVAPGEPGQLNAPLADLNPRMPPVPPVPPIPPRVH